MSDIDKVRDGLDRMAAMDPDFQRACRDGEDALDRIESALRALTAEHGSQCQCQGCAVLRGREKAP